MRNYISKLPSAVFAETWPRRVVVLGATGSIGRSTLSVISNMPGYFKVLALAGGRNIDLLAEQALEFTPPYLAVQDDEAAARLKAALAGVAGYKPTILSGPAGYSALAVLPEADMVLSGQSGAAGLNATFAAVRAGKVIALANKESLILAGDIIRAECARSGAMLLPVDSEHNAIFQCLMGQNTRALPERLEAARLGEGKKVPTVALKRIILTASGGPFLGRDAASLSRVTKADALAHPTWNMGAKITIDSSTLMNKGMEYVEACHLYGVPPAKVDVVIHPQSIIHSFVEFEDNSRLAQLGVPDMRVPISDCLGWPYRLHSGADELDLTKYPPLSFFKPDTEAFPALGYWREAYEEGRGMTVALNAANEVAVALFLDEKISYTGITRLSRLVLDKWDESAPPQDIDAVLGMDAKARALARQFAAQL